MCLEKVAQCAPQEEFFYVDIGSVDNQRKAIVEPSRLAAKDAPSRARQTLRRGDVLVSLTRPNLNAVAVVPPNLDGSIGSTGFDVLRAVACETGLLFAFVRSPGFVARMSGLVQGALYPAVRPRDVRETEFPLPPLNEQRRIVAKLEALQARSRRAREALDAVPPLLEKLRQSILAAAFRGDLTKDWRAKHKDVEPASELLKRIRTERRKKWEEAELAKMKAKGRAPTDDKWKAKYKEPEDLVLDELTKGFVGPIPPTWILGSLAEGAEVTTGGTPSTVNELYWDGPIPFVTPSEIHPDGHVLTSKRRVTPSGAEDAGTVQSESVLIVCIGTVGKVGYLETASVVNQQINALTPLGSIHPRYLYYWCKLLRVWVERAASATVNAAILNKTRLAKGPFVVAPHAEQVEVVRRLETAFLAIRATEMRCAALSARIRETDFAILAAAFRGELVPQDPNDEPAEAMLARVRGANGATTTETKPKRGRKTVGPAREMVDD